MLDNPERFYTFDFGGSSLKAATADGLGTLLGEKVRTPIRYPYTPEQLVRDVQDALGVLPAGDAIVVGLPGMIREGKIVHTPHYINLNGPFTERSDQLARVWNSFDAAAILRHATGLPTVVVNDSELHGAALIEGTGLEVAFTLGTGLGSSHFSHGQLQAHLEMSHAPITESDTFDTYIGNRALQEIGPELWNQRVISMIRTLYPVYLWDRGYLGGGNTFHITGETRDLLSDEFHIRVVKNRAALSGGARVFRGSHVQ